MHATRLTPEIRDVLCSTRRGGATYEKCAAEAGIPKFYITRWRSLGKAGREPFASFARDWDAATEDADRAVRDSFLHKLRTAA
jgi:hypothetical protein